jgi:hypothetical protein
MNIFNKIENIFSSSSRRKSFKKFKNSYYINYSLNYRKIFKDCPNLIYFISRINSDDKPDTNLSEDEAISYFRYVSALIFSQKECQKILEKHIYYIFRNSYNILYNSKYRNLNIYSIGSYKIYFTVDDKEMCIVK